MRKPPVGTKNKHMIQESLSREKEVAMIVDEHGYLKEVNSAWEDFFGYELAGDEEMHSNEVCNASKMDKGKRIARIQNGETVTVDSSVETKDGTVYGVTARLEPVADSTDIHITQMNPEVVEQTSGAPKSGLDASVFDDVTDKELEEVVDNVRVEGPEQDIPLAAIMLDVTEGHTDLEQYKLGAYSLYEAVDERLAEENEQNPDSTTAKVLEEVKDATYGLYLRVQRGDAELEGQRGGEYSGYFN
jgi:PAS domain S-box-containing protein